VHVTVEHDEVAVVEICRPPNNYIDIALISQLATACDDLAVAGCRAIVLCSQGKHFCAGANFAKRPSEGAAGIHLYDVAIRLFDQPVPIVAAIQGAAIGAGLGLALVADFRIATPDARFSANFSRLGFHHGFGLTATLPPVIGQQASLDMLYSGRRVDGAVAEAIGLCDALVPQDQLRSAALAQAIEIAKSAPLAIRSIRETMRRPLVEAVRAALSRERSEQERLQKTQDWQEGVAAMSDRRLPKFVGR
jgi:enoyl-CoA hydratase/carnithine racemase